MYIKSNGNSNNNNNKRNNNNDKRNNTSIGKGDVVLHVINYKRCNEDGTF